MYTDFAGGGLETEQMTPGDISDVHIWYPALANNDVESLSCEAHGNIRKFEEIEIIGNQKMKRRSQSTCSE